MSMFDFESWSIDIRDNLPVEYIPVLSHHVMSFFRKGKPGLQCLHYALYHTQTTNPLLKYSYMDAPPSPRLWTARARSAYS